MRSQTTNQDNKDKSPDYLKLEGQNYYERLGLTPNATQTEIKASKKILTKYHPDKNPSISAKDEFGLIFEAYETLKDEQLKRVYDNSLQNGLGIIPYQAEYKKQDAFKYDIKESLHDIRNVCISNNYVAIPIDRYGGGIYVYYHYTGEFRFKALNQKTNHHVYYDVMISEVENLLYATTPYGIEVFSLQNGHLVREFKNLIDFVSDSAAVIGGNGKARYVYDGKSYLKKINQEGKVEETISIVQANKITLSPDEKYAIVSSGSSSGVFIYDLKNGHLVHEFYTEFPVYYAEISPDGRYIACGGGSKIVNLYDLKTEKCEQVPVRGTSYETDPSRREFFSKDPVCRVHSLNFSPNNKYIIIGEWTYGFSIYSIDEKKIVYESERMPGYINNVFFTHNNRIIINDNKNIHNMPVPNGITITSHLIGADDVHLLAIEDKTKALSFFGSFLQIFGFSEQVSQNQMTSGPSVSSQNKQPMEESKVTSNQFELNEKETERKTRGNNEGKTYDNRNDKDDDIPELSSDLLGPSLPSLVNNDIKYVVFDWDDTLSNSSELGSPDRTLAYPKETISLFHRLADQGINIIIASQQTPVSDIRKCLQINRIENKVEEIYFGKRDRVEILKKIAAYKCNNDPQKVCLVDDSKTNCRNASENNFRAILVKDIKQRKNGEIYIASPQHLDDIIKECLPNKIALDSNAGPNAELLSNIDDTLLIRTSTPEGTGESKKNNEEIENKEDDKGKGPEYSYQFMKDPDESALPKKNDSLLLSSEQHDDDLEITVKKNKHKVNEQVEILFCQDSIKILKEFGTAIIAGSLSKDQKKILSGKAPRYLSQAIELLSFFITENQLKNLVEDMQEKEKLFVNNKANTHTINTNDKNIVFRKKKLSEIIKLLEFLQTSLKVRDFNTFVITYLQNLINAKDHKSLRHEIRKVHENFNKWPKRTYAYKIKAETWQITYNSLGDAEPSQIKGKNLLPYNSMNYIFAINEDYTKSVPQNNDGFSEAGKWIIELPNGDPRLDKIWKGLLKLINENKIFEAKVSPINVGYDTQVICVYNPSIRNIGEIKQVYKYLETILNKVGITPDKCNLRYKADYDTEVTKKPRHTTYEELKSYDDNRKCLTDVLKLINAQSKKEYFLSSTAKTIKQYIEDVLKRNPIITAKTLSNAIEFISSELKGKNIVTQTSDWFSFITNIGKRSQATVDLYTAIFGCISNIAFKKVHLEKTIKEMYPNKALDTLVYNDIKKVNKRKDNISVYQRRDNLLGDRLRHGLLNKASLFPDEKNKNVPQYEDDPIIAQLKTVSPMFSDFPVPISRVNNQDRYVAVSTLEISEKNSNETNIAPKNPVKSMQAIIASPATASVRLAKAEDYPVVYGGPDAYFRQFANSHYEEELVEDFNNIKKGHAPKTHTILVMENDKKEIIGAIAFTKQKVPEIQALYIDKDYRKQNYGILLTSAVAKYAKQFDSEFQDQNKQHLSDPLPPRLQLGSVARSVGFWQKAGFEVLSTTKSTSLGKTSMSERMVCRAIDNLNNYFNAHLNFFDDDSKALLNQRRSEEELYAEYKNAKTNENKEKSSKPQVLTEERMLQIIKKYFGDNKDKGTYKGKNDDQISLEMVKKLFIGKDLTTHRIIETLISAANKAQKNHQPSLFKPSCDFKNTVEKILNKFPNEVQAYRDKNDQWKKSVLPPS